LPRNRLGGKRRRKVEDILQNLDEENMVWGDLSKPFIGFKIASIV
jgi:hypothetical protein